MPRFMDYHQDLKLPAEAIAQIAEDTRNGKADEFGVRQIELYHNAEGQVYCLLEGPDEESIRRHHAALGVPCGDVHQGKQPHLTWPGPALSPSPEARGRAALHGPVLPAPHSISAERPVVLPPRVINC